MQKVSQLIHKHQLEMADIQGHSLDNDQPVGHERDAIQFGSTSSDGTWERTLITKIARAYMCDAIFNWNWTSVSIVGKPNDVLVVKYVFSIAYNTIKNLSSKRFNEKRKDLLERSKVEWDVLDAPVGEDKLITAYCLALLDNGLEVSTENIKDNYSLKIKGGRVHLRLKNPEKAKLISYRKVWVRSYLSGAVVGISEALSREKQQFADTPVGKELVRVSDTLIRDYVNENFNVKSKGSRSATGDSDAWSSGRKDGKNTQFNAGVSRGNNGFSSIIKKLN